MILTQMISFLEEEETNIQTTTNTGSSTEHATDRKEGSSSSSSRCEPQSITVLNDQMQGRLPHHHHRRRWQHRTHRQQTQVAKIWTTNQVCKEDLQMEEMAKVSSKWIWSKTWAPWRMMELYKIRAPTQYNAQRQPPINHENKYGHQTTNEQRRRSNITRKYIPNRSSDSGGVKYSTG